jgi:hypothetical protein
MADYLANLGRSVLEGLTFNNAGEIEAAIRAASQGDLNKYRQLKRQVEGDYRRWADKNPGSSLAGEFSGALLPGVVGAFVPGGQGASVSAASMIPRVARAMAEPLTVAAERFAPSLAVRGARVLPLADEVLTGAVQSVGSADTLADAPERIAEDMPTNVAGSLAVRGANAALKKRLAVRRARKGRS